MTASLWRYDNISSEEALFSPVEEAYLFLSKGMVQVMMKSFMDDSRTSSVDALMAGPSACVVQEDSSTSRGSTLAFKDISLPSAADPR